MKKQIKPAIRTHLHWAVSILILIFLAIQVMPRALGQSRSRGPQCPALHSRRGELDVERWRVGRFKAFFEMQPAGDFP